MELIEILTYDPIIRDINRNDISQAFIVQIDFLEALFQFAT